MSCNAPFNKIKLGLLSFLLIGYTSTSFSKDLEAGVSGYIQLYPLFESLQSNTDARNDKQILNSFDDKKNTQGHLTPYVLGKLAYTFANKKVQLFLSSTEDNILDNSFYLQLGMRYYFDPDNHIEFTYLPNMHTKEVWQDPFVLGTNREKTNVDAQGFRMTSEFKVTIPIQFRYTFATTKIVDDQAGTFSKNIDNHQLTQGELADLKRSGDYHLINIKPIIPFIYTDNEQLLLLPEVTYTIASLDGKSNAYNGASGAVTLYYKLNPIAIAGSLMIGENRYEGSHPIFNRKRKDQIYSATLLFNYYEPFDFKNVGLNLTLSYLSNQSNISFYEQSNKQISAGLWWEF